MINEVRKLKDALGKLSFILNREQKRYCVLIFLMSLVAALFETLGISVIIPVVQVIISADDLMSKSYMAPFISLLNITTKERMIIFVCVCVGIVYIIKNSYSVFYTWASAKFSNKIRRELSVRVLHTYMKQGYIFFISNNSSRLIRGISSDVISVQNVISNFFSFLGKAMIIACMTIFIIVKSPIIALWILFLVVLCFVTSQVIFRKPMRQFGESSREYAYRSSQASLEAIQGHKEVLVFGRQDYFVNEYLNNTIGYNKAEVQMAVASTTPYYLIEVICVIGLLVVIAVECFVTKDASNLLTQMTTIALAAFRILPALGALLGNVNTIVFNAPGLAAASETLHMVNELDKEKASDCGIKTDVENKIHLENQLVLSHITYAYPNTDKKVIDDLSMTIEKGTSIGFIGTSGAGKTTLADIILALLKPQKGEILMDGINVEKIEREWHHVIGYVPQSIYMIDASIRRNVAFGIEETKVDDSKVWRALEMAQIKEFVENLPNGLETNVGEWGVQLSGGQRQRIAIARALYNEPDIIVLDEATAALDNETENAVMESIEALQKLKTLIIVAHRLTTIRKCDKIYEIVDGKAVLRDKEDIFSPKESL